MISLIRLACLSDAPELAKLHVEAAGETLPVFTIEQRLELWHHLLGGGPRRIQTWVALDSLGTLLGFVSGGKARVCPPGLSDSDYGELSMIYVAPSVQKKGVGHVLFFKALECLAASGFPAAFARASKESAAFGFFIRMGGLSETHESETRVHWKNIKLAQEAKADRLY